MREGSPAAGASDAWDEVTKTHMKQSALCIDNVDFEENLIRGKVYRVLPDPKAAREDMVRIVDESEEDNLYLSRHFMFVDFPPEVKKKIVAMGTPPPKE